jgi:Tfp pilus assembly protein PilF
MRVLRSLRQRYPRNRLVLLEAGATATRAGKPAEAETLLTEGLALLARESRAKIPGEEALWHYKRGAARVLLGRADDALADLRQAQVPGAAAWVQGRAHLEMARLAAKQGDKVRAKQAATQAVSICRQGGDPICVEEARKIR